MSKVDPSDFWLRLLKWFCKPEYHRDIEGDLLELFDRRVENQGLRKAKWLFCKDVLLLCRPGIIRSYSFKFSYMLRENLKIAGRQMFRNKVFTAINLAGLTVGMTTSLLILIWTQNEWSFDKFYPNSNQLYRIICHWEGEGEQLTIPTIPIRLRDLASEEIPEIEEFFVMHPGFDNPLLKNPEGQTFAEADLAYVSEHWLDEFDYKAVRGSVAAFRSNKFGLALTEERAKKFFGEADPIGKTLEVFSANYTVEVVFKKNPVNSSFQQEVLLPLKSYWPHRLTYERELKSSNYKFVAFFRATEEIDREKIEAQLSGIISRVDQDKPTSASVIPLTTMRFEKGIDHDVFKHQSYSMVSIFALIAVIILLAAILNYINLSTAVIGQRIQEIGIRKVFGAGYQQIFSQFVTETALISLIAFALAMIGVYFLMPSVAEYTGLALELDLTNKYLWFLFVAVLGLATLVATIYPALLHAGVQPLQLVQTREFAGKGISLRRVLVTSQFTAAIVVLISTAVIYQQLKFIQNKDVGYDRSQVVSLRLKHHPGDDYRKNSDQFMLLKKELEQLKGVESVAMADGTVADISNRNSGSLSWEGKPEDQSVIVAQLRTNEDLISVFDLKMARGRWFSPENSHDRNNIIINETAIKEFNIPEPVIGRWSRYQGREGQIIGVVKDFIFGDFHHASEPLVVWHNQGRGRLILARLQANNADGVLKEVEGQFKRFFPDKPFEYTFLDDAFQRMHERDLKTSALLRTFTGIIIFISCLGLLGLTIFDAKSRSKEVAIRKVLGASVLNILEQLSRRYIILVGAAFLIAVPIAAYAMQNWLENFAYRIDLSWWIFMIPGIVAILISVAVMSFHSLKAALSNPVDALRQ